MKMNAIHVQISCDRSAHSAHTEPLTLALNLTRLGDRLTCTRTITHTISVRNKLIAVCWNIENSEYPFLANQTLRLET